MREKCENPFAGRMLPAVSGGGLDLEDYWTWCSSVIEGEDGEYHMFASGWPKRLGFGSNWLFNSQILHAVSGKPQGPYRLADTALGRRGREFFDGMNVHNPCIRKWKEDYYLYYMGTTYGGGIPQSEEEISSQRSTEVWNRKRIGVAVAKSVYGPWVRMDTPLLEPRDCRYWDCTVTTNPAVAIQEDGTTYLIYKSRNSADGVMQLGIARAPSPTGPFERVSDEPIMRFDNRRWQVEDPYLWFQDGRFHMLFKNDFKESWDQIPADWGAGMYAVSEDAVHWEIAEDSLVYTRRVQWDNGRVTVQANLERPFLLHDRNGEPTHLFLAAGDGERPYCFTHTKSLVIPIGGRI